MTLAQALNIVLNRCGGKLIGTDTDKITNEQIFLFDCGNNVTSCIRQDIIFKMAANLTA
jgi:hypothetical protein